MSTTISPTINRRHDLDALRGVAMLLGIVLHGTISFIPGIGAGWAVQDTQTNGLFAVLLAAIHGFRMPLFFLISGFFTAMLWRKRGLPSLLAQRFKRIFIPMVIALFTIIPANWIVAAYVKADPSIMNAAAAVEQAPRDIIMAAAVGDNDRIKELLASGIDIETRDPYGTTPLLVAVFFGRAETAELLSEQGANVSAINHKGETVVDMLKAPFEITEFVANMINVDVNRQSLQQGRERIAKMLPKNSSADFATKSSPASEKLDADGGLAGSIALLTFFPLFGHLWFLWFLSWLVLGFAVFVCIGKIAGVRRPPTWLALSRTRYLWLLPLTAVPQFFMGFQGSHFGPDTSLGILPVPAVLAYYAIFFAFGVLYYDANDEYGLVGKSWRITVPLALLVVFPIGLSFGAEYEGLGRVASVSSQVAYVWLMSFGLMGLFRSLLTHESKTMRYLSDSSYWLYLVHIPLIIYVQYLVRDWPLSAWIKFPIVCVVTSGILLLSYQVFVRYTPIGTLLNGPRRRSGQSKSRVDETPVMAAIVEEAPLQIEPIESMAS